METGNITNSKQYNYHNYTNSSQAYANNNHSHPITASQPTIAKPTQSTFLKQVDTKVTDLVQSYAKAEAYPTPTNTLAVDETGTAAIGLDIQEAISHYVSNPTQAKKLGATSAEVTRSLKNYDTTNLNSAENKSISENIDSLFDSIGISKETAGNFLSLVTSWDNLDNSSRLQAGLSLGLQAFKEAGFISKETANTYENSANQIFQAASILQSDAHDRDKVIALGGLGVQAAQSHNLISGTQAAGANAILSSAALANNWGDMSDFQRTQAALQTTQSVFQGLSSVTGTNVGKDMIGMAGSKLVSSAAGAVSIVSGVDMAVDVIDAISDMPRSQAQKAGAIGMASAGMSIGLGVAGISAASAAAAGAEAGTVITPGIGTAIGAAIGAVVGLAMGSFGSGKSSSQKMRDAWRDNLENNSFAQMIDKAHHVPLADGSLYKIGVDGKNTFPNKDGSTRLTYEIDSGNKVATNSIPYAHIYALATGLNPSQRKGGLWDRAVGQTVNAATSNATTLNDAVDNYRTMLQAGDVEPRTLAMQIEIMRVSNKINDQEYAVYLDKINDLFSSKLLPTPREKAEKGIAEMILKQENRDSYSTEILQVLTNPQKKAESLRELDQRLRG